MDSLKVDYHPADRSKVERDQSNQEVDISPPSFIKSAQI